MRLNELEVKIAIDSEEDFKKTFDSCIKFFGSPCSHFKQLDEYYDDIESQLKKLDLVLRIRTIGETKIIALKGPRMELASGMTKRLELEFESAHSSKVHEQLLHQGLKTNESYEKERWTFIHNDCEIVFDKLPFIGSFIEIEGPSEEAIFDLMKKLNLSSDAIVRKHYGELIKKKFQELGLPLDKIHATYAKEQELRTQQTA